MRHSFATLAAALALVVSCAAIALPAAFAQPRGEEVQPPPPVHPIKRLWRDVDQLNFEIDQIHIYSRYCKPPKGPNKADTQWEIDFADSKYKSLQQQFDRMHQAFQAAIKSRMTANFRSNFPTLDGLTADNRDYWAKTSQMLTRLANRIQDLQARLNRKKEEDCTKDNRQPPPPPPPPTDWLKGLERPVAAPTSQAELPPHFCTEFEKTDWILKHVSPPRIQAAENARIASYYVVDVGKRMRDLEVRGIFEPLTADEQRGLKELRAEHKWAKDNLAEQDRAAAAMDAHYAAALKIPVIDCTQRPQTGAMGADTIAQPNYELFVYPALPPRFCSQQEKDGVISQLTVALQIATRNYDMANARVSEIADRIAKGDNSASTSQAFRTASDAASSYFKTMEHLRAEIAKAEAMPVVDCGKAAQTQTGTEAIIESGTAPTETSPPRTTETKPRTREGRGEPVIIDPPKDPVIAPPPKGPSSLGYTEDHRPTIAIGGGYVETDTPQQFIGRIVSGGTDFAMIFTPRNLDGFYGEIDVDVPLARDPWWGTRASLDFGFRYSDVEGDAFRFVEADPALTTGFVWIDPLDPTIPFAVGLGGANLAWEAHASSSSTNAFATALYREYREFSRGFTGSIGVGLMAGVQETEHNTYIENLDFAAFGVYENYEFSSFGFGPRFEGALDWECEPNGRGLFANAAFVGRFGAHVAPMYDWRDIYVGQRAMGPFFGGFDHYQRVDFDDDGFNLRYGLDAEIGLKFSDRTTVFLKAGWQGETDAPTIIPADGSFAPGTPIRSDTENASEWFVGLGVRGTF